MNNNKNNLFSLLNKPIYYDNDELKELLLRNLKSYIEDFKLLVNYDVDDIIKCLNSIIFLLEEGEE